MSTVFDNQEVYITIKDENDEVPVFKNAPYPFRATVPHDASPGTSVYQLMAEDSDGGSEIRYVMESGRKNCQTFLPFELRWYLVNFMGITICQKENYSYNRFITLIYAPIFISHAKLLPRDN